MDALEGSDLVRPPAIGLGGVRDAATRPRKRHAWEPRPRVTNFELPSVCTNALLDHPSSTSTQLYVGSSGLLEWCSLRGRTTTAALAYWCCLLADLESRSIGGGYSHGNPIPNIFGGPLFVGASVNCHKDIERMPTHRVGSRTLPSLCPLPIMVLITPR